LFSNRSIADMPFCRARVIPSSMSARGATVRCSAIVESASLLIVLGPRGSSRDPPLQAYARARGPASKDAIRCPSPEQSHSPVECTHTQYLFRPAFSAEVYADLGRDSAQSLEQGKRRTGVISELLLPFPNQNMVRCNVEIGASLRCFASACPRARAVRFPLWRNATTTP
jgi:hypothetical protein